MRSAVIHYSFRAPAAEDELTIRPSDAGPESSQLFFRDNPSGVCYITPVERQATRKPEGVKQRFRRLEEDLTNEARQRTGFR